MALIRVNKANTGSKSCSFIKAGSSNDDAYYFYANSNAGGGGYVSSVDASPQTASDLISITYSNGDFTLTVKEACHLYFKLQNTTAVDEDKAAGFTQTFSRTLDATLFAYSV